MKSMELDLFSGEAAKAAGMALVTANNPEWKDTVRAVILSLSGEFTNDDVRIACRAIGLPSPKSPNAWGAAICAVAKTGAIRRVGYRKSAIPSTHARVVAVWRRNFLRNEPIRLSQQ